MPEKIGRTRKTRRLRDIGYQDALAGKPIDAFKDVPLARHSESLRAEYEIGYRAAKQENKCNVWPMRADGTPKTMGELSKEQQQQIFRDAVEALKPEFATIGVDLELDIDRKQS